jgi:N-acetylmuramic acid 6-phosphate etherase
VVAHQAGGRAALVAAVEDAEDDEDAARRDAGGVRSGDLVIGLAASGRTPYVGRALAVARSAGAVTVLVTSNPAAPLSADHVLVTDTGAEAITGSTRLKAGTAQKLVLHTFSTALMVRLGRTYGNLMIDVRATNAKLRGRAIRLLEQATGRSPDDCAAALHDCDDLRTAVVCLLLPGDPDPERARDALARAGGDVRAAVQSGVG